jgi:hypothetical protein
VPTVRTMAWVFDTDGSARGRTTKTKGRGKAWLPDENVGVVLAVCNLPDASIDGANMRTAAYERKVYDQFVQHAPSLDELPDQSKVWRGRSPVDPFLAMQYGSDSKQCRASLLTFRLVLVDACKSGRCTPLSKRST